MTRRRRQRHITFREMIPGARVRAPQIRIGWDHTPIASGTLVSWKWLGRHRTITIESDDGVLFVAIQQNTYLETPCP